MSSLSSTLARAGRGLWWFLDASRRTVLNLLLIALVAALAWALMRGGPPALQPKTALVLDLSGRISEQRPGSNRGTLLRQLRGDEDGGARLRDVLAVIDAATQDPAITHALLMTDELGAAGLPTLREVAAALQRFKAAGKPVIAWGANFDQRGYYLAAQASEVWLHPMGSISVQGYGRLRSYYKDLLDKVGVTAHVVRAGKFKNAGETFTASAPSAETLESDGALYGALWTTWTTGVEEARKQPAGSVMQAVDSLPASLEATGGDFAAWALQRKWVDALKSAAARGKLGVDYRTVYVEAAPGRLDRWLRRFGLSELGDAVTAWTEPNHGTMAAAPLRTACASRLDRGGHGRVAA